jgi:membrane-bound serine protease (ClpP class)
VAALLAILLAIFVLPAHWGLVAIIAGLTVEVGEAWLWIRLSRRWRVVTGAEGLVGRTAEVVEDCRPDGRVRIHGELWRAHCEGGAKAGTTVRVVSIDDLTLQVEPEGTRQRQRT